MPGSGYEVFVLNTKTQVVGLLLTLYLAYSVFVVVFDAFIKKETFMSYLLAILRFSIHFSDTFRCLHYNIS
jgi:hypothetical protein